MMGTMRQPAFGRWIDAVSYLLLFLSALWMKSVYSHADTGELQWILAPTARAIEWFSTMAFEYEEGSGFIDRSRGVIIAPACAGVNFMIIAFGMTGCIGLRAAPCGFRKLIWLPFSAASACLLTIIANTLRIIAAVHLYRADIYGGWVTPERVHRMAGILVYLLLLYGMALAVAGWTRNRPRQNGACDKMLLCMPMAWYAALTVGIPLLNRAYTGAPYRFAEHCSMVLAGCAIAFWVVHLVHSAIRNRCADRDEHPACSNRNNGFKEYR